MFFMMADSLNWAEAVESQEQQVTSGVGHLSVSEPPGLMEDDVETTKAEASLLTKILRTKLIENTHDVQVQQNDPNSPLFPAKTSFEELGLSPNLLKGIYGMGFNKLSKIQETALPLLLDDPPQNLIAQSQSGTGKTAAVVFAMLSRVDPSNNYPQAICLSPTFDLAKQTGSVIEKMKKFSPEIKMGYAVRGVKSGQNRGEKVTEHILVGTAGTVLDWVMKLRSFDPKLIKMFVLDDADIIIDTQGQQDQTIRIYRYFDDRCQKVLFGTTFSDETMDFAKKIINNPTIITLKRSEEFLSKIKQYYVWYVGDEGKFTFLSNLYAVLTIGQCIVFCSLRTHKIATWLAEKMAKEGHSVCLITGEATIEQKIHVLDRFCEGKEKLMITTNLCARGIHIEKVTLVVNYDIPLDVTHRPDCETYLHRISRTGRFGKSGLAVNFVDGRNSYDNLMYIQKHFGREIVKLDASDPDEIGKLQES